MTTEQTQGDVTEAEVAAVGEKFAAWADGLTPKEQFILRRALRGAATAGEDVAGYIDREPDFFGMFRSFSLGQLPRTAPPPPGPPPLGRPD